MSGTTVFEGHVLQELDDPDWRSLVGMGIGVLLQDAVGSWDPLDFIGLQSGEALLEHTDLTQEEVQQRVLDALGEVGLSERRHFTAFAHEVSRGQRSGACSHRRCCPPRACSSPTNRSPDSTSPWGEQSST